MAINFNTSVLSLYGANVANDAAYQSPGTYGLSLGNVSGGVGSIVVGGTNNAYTTVPSYSTTGSVTTGTGDTYSVRMKLATEAVNAAGTGYVPGDTIMLTYGTPLTSATKSVLTVTHTKVVSATITAPGTGGTPGAATVTGTTGTGTKFQASVTISGGGAISSVNSISVAGDYTVNPTAIAAEPVTGGGLTGAQLNVVMGVLTATVSTAGLYTAVATSATQFSTSGTGTGFTANTMTFSVDSVAVLTPGTGFVGALTGAFGSGNATATVTPGTSNQSEDRIITLIDVVQSFVGSANSVEEVKLAREVLWRMLSRLNTGGTASLSTLATSAQKAGLLKYNSTSRSTF